MIITRIGPLAFAKISGAVYALLGLFLGALLSVASLIPTAASTPTQVGVSAVTGVFAIFVMPIVYGILGFVMSLAGAWLYNQLAGAIGGIELEVQTFD